jgi:non-specific serine/threonine protein kinase
VALQQLGRVTLEEDPARAMRLMGGAAAYLERTGTVEPAFLRRRADAARQWAAQLLGAPAAAQTFEDGRRMSLDDAMACADVEPAAVVRRTLGGLTQREMQVAALLGRHHTNRDIGRILFISERTAEIHVEHILAKLGLNNRRELAVWAQENDLVDDVKRP